MDLQRAEAILRGQAESWTMAEQVEAERLVMAELERLRAELATARITSEE